MNNLPVLYYIPKWKLVKGSGRNKYYYISELNKYIYCRKLNKYLSFLGMTVQDYYDRWFLNITTPSQRPRCKNCGIELKFRSIECRNYGEYCSNSCHKSLTMKGNSNTLGHKLTKIHKERIGIGVRESFDRNNTRELISKSMINRYKNPNIRLISSIAQKLRWSRPEERIKSSIRISKYSNTEEFRYKCSVSTKESYIKDPTYSKRVSDGVRRSYINNPELRIKQSKSHRKLWENPSDKLLKTLGGGKRGVKNVIFSKYENKNIKLDSLLERRFYLKFSNFSNVSNIIRLPIRIKYFDSINKMYRTYFPDFLVEYTDKPSEIVEVKPNTLVNNTIVKDKTYSSIDMCYLLGVKYSIITEDYIDKNLLTGYITY